MHTITSAGSFRRPGTSEPALHALSAHRWWRSIVFLGLGMLAAALAGCADDPEWADVAGLDSGRDRCDWPTFGHDLDRSFSYPCESTVDPASVDGLGRAWWFGTTDVVSAQPVVVDGRLFVGDWSGRFHALDAETGDELWSYDVEPAQVYAGQITASAAVVDHGSRQLVVFNGGRSVHAVDAETGEAVWVSTVGEEGTPAEIETAPLVVGDTVIVTWDVHNGPFETGMTAFALDDGSQRWHFDAEEGRTPRGCGDMWGAASVDLELGLIYTGTANCPPSPEGWGRHTEAIVAVRLADGRAEWTFQPHEPNNDDLDFAGAPLLFDAAGVPAVGVGNKDGVFYALDRADGELLWSTQAAPANVLGPNLSAGGFIGASALAGDVIVGGTAVGDCPCLHALDVDSGEIVWQQNAVGPTYAPTTTVNGVAFVGGVDFTLRAIDTASGEVLWSDQLPGGISGGVAIVEDTVWAPVGFREPGSPGPSETAGIVAYRLGVATEAELPGTTSVGEGGPARLVDGGADCLDTGCDVPFGLKDPPPGSNPTMTLTFTDDPFTITVETDDLGDPDGWIRPGTETADVGAEVYVLAMSERDDDPNGGILCVLADGTCTTDRVPSPGATYNRISLLAVADTEVMPSPAEGLDRLVTTIAFSPPLVTEALEGADGGADSVDQGTAGDTTPPDEDTTTGAETASAAGGGFVLSGQGNNLVAYGLEPAADGTWPRQQVITNAADDPAGLDINAQPCVLADGRVILGEDTGQPDPPAGFGIFTLEGTGVGELEAAQVGKLTPSYQPGSSDPENYGCVELDDGRVLTTDVGNQAEGDGTGQLVVWFPPIEGTAVAHCKVSIDIATAQALLLDNEGDGAFLASSRPPSWGVWHYDTVPTAPEDCTASDADGTPLAVNWPRERILTPSDGLLAVNGLAHAPDGGLYVSSVITGTINEYDAEGTYRRTILTPPEGGTLGAEPYSTGTPLGLDTGPDGSLYYADIGLVRDGDGVGTGDRRGSVRVIRFVDGEPEEPIVIEAGLRFPDGVKVVES